MTFVHKYENMYNVTHPLKTVTSCCSLQKSTGLLLIARDPSSGRGLTLLSPTLFLYFMMTTRHFYDRCTFHPTKSLLYRHLRISGREQGCSSTPCPCTHLHILRCRNVRTMVPGR